jgi:hypothetical protein
VEHPSAWVDVVVGASRRAEKGSKRKFYVKDVLIVIPKEDARALDLRFLAGVDKFESLAFFITARHLKRDAPS